MRSPSILVVCEDTVTQVTGTTGTLGKALHGIQTTTRSTSHENVDRSIVIGSSVWNWEHHGACGRETPEDSRRYRRYAVRGYGEAVHGAGTCFGIV